MNDPMQDAGAPEGLSHAGAVVDKAIEYMAGQNISQLAIASALLGGAMGLLSHELGDAAGWQTLDRAIDNCESNHLFVVIEMHGAPGGFERRIMRLL